MKTPPYNANAVFDALKLLHRLPSDAALSELIDVRRDAISSMRAGRIPFGLTVQNKIIQHTRMSARRLRFLMLTEAE